jgi:NTP pyrophosphatase (non-canonical NTP hydrolase)
MELDEYQARAGDSDNCAHIGLVYYALGLAGEAGECADKLKKHFRDDGEAHSGGYVPTWSSAHPELIGGERREAFKKELGDVLWYVARFAHHLGFTLDDVARGNIEKLASRMDRDLLGGDGDDR